MKKNSGALKWEDSIGIEQAENLKKQLTDAIKKNKSVSLDISGVTDMDTSSIQLILAARKEAENLKKEFFVTGDIPQDVSALFALLGLEIPVKEA